MDSRTNPPDPIDPLLANLISARVSALSSLASIEAALSTYAAVVGGDQAQMAAGIDPASLVPEPRERAHSNPALCTHPRAATIETMTGAIQSICPDCGTTTIEELDPEDVLTL